MIPLFILFSLGQVGRISLFNQQINFYLYEILMVVYLLWLIYKYHFVAAAARWYKSILIFCGILVLSFVVSIYKFSGFENLIGGLYLGRLILYFLFFIYLNFHLKKIPNSKFQIQNSILIFSILTFITSIIQYFLYPDLRNLYYLGWDPHLYRTFGLFFDTSISAAVYGLILLYLINSNVKTQMSKPQLKGQNLVNLGMIAVYSLLGLLSFSRGFYISIIITSIYLLFQKKLYRYSAILILLFFVGIYLLPKPAGEGVNLKRTFSIESRILENKKAIEIWQKNPILGIGYNRIGAVKEVEPESHSRAGFPSSFLIILATVGLLGAISFIIMLKNLAMISNPSKLYILFLSIFSLFDNILLHPFILFLMFGFLAVEVSRARTLQ